MYVAMCKTHFCSCCLARRRTPRPHLGCTRPSRRRCKSLPCARRAMAQRKGRRDPSKSENGITHETPIGAFFPPPSKSIQRGEDHESPLPLVESTHFGTASYLPKWKAQGGQGQSAKTIEHQEDGAVCGVQPKQGLKLGPFMNKRTYIHLFISLSLSLSLSLSCLPCL